jgi:Holliday junction resolvase RusA-like endonuclease
VSKLILTFSRPGKPKPRPRGKGKHFYNPPDYTEWKADIAEEVALRYRKAHFKGPVSIGISFARKTFTVTIEETDRQRHGRSDIDNLAGGVLDALQDAGIIENDRFVTVLEAWFDVETD